MSLPRPRAAYVHVPFCRHRCGYCNFTVLAGRDDLIEDYLRALEIELSWMGEPQRVDTLFFGGGTPTHLSADQLNCFLELVTTWFPTEGNAEVSIEANPEDIDASLIETLRGRVTRVSLGVQSFRSSKLQTLERGHAGDQVGRCIELLRPIVDSISLDLIFGAPEETIEQWSLDLQQAIELSPNHISTYGLTFEEGTSFHSRRARRELFAVEETAELKMYEHAIDRLAEANFEHYEVSNFARPGHRCRHNEKYWLCESFFGVGPGASSFLDGQRRSNVRSTTKYLDRVLKNESPIEESSQLTANDLAHERLVFGLRRLQGVRLRDFETQTGQTVTQLVGEPLQLLLEQGLLEQDEESIRLTRKGLMVSDSIWPYLL